MSKVNHPVHYNKHPSGIECIDVAEGFSFNLGNVIKYVWRFNEKDGLVDLKKALWYLTREIERLDANDSRNTKMAVYGGGDSDGS